MAGVREPEGSTRVLVPEDVAGLAGQAGLGLALEAFPSDLVVAARIAAEMTAAIRRLGDPGLAPWAPMRPGNMP